MSLRPLSLPSSPHTVFDTSSFSSLLVLIAGCECPRSLARIPRRPQIHPLHPRPPQKHNLPKTRKTNPNKISPRKRKDRSNKGCRTREGIGSEGCRIGFKVEY